MYQHNTIVGKKEEALTFKDKYASNSTETKSTIKLPELEGDTQIFLGQTIVTLIRLNIENDVLLFLFFQVIIRSIMINTLNI